MIDRKRVRESFGRQAHEYDNHASVQKIVHAGFIELLKGAGLAPRFLLDIGSGTGTLLSMLRGMYGDVRAVGIDLALGMCRKARENTKTDSMTHFLTADAECLPFSDSSFDLVLSTSTFQWVGQLDRAFAEAFRVLMPGGVFSFALFGEHTLYELRNSYRSTLDAQMPNEEDRTHSFPTREEVESALNRAGFSECSIVSRIERDVHETVPSLLRSLKRIGAGNASPVTPRGLAGKRIMLDMMQRYRDDFGQASYIPATYEIIYGVGRRES